MHYFFSLQKFTKCRQEKITKETQREIQQDIWIFVWHVPELPGELPLGWSLVSSNLRVFFKFI
jgi:hypothetical protein